MPGPADVLLLIEVAETGLGHGRATEVPLHAESGVQDYWIVTVGERAVEAHRNPVDGRCAEARPVSTGVLDILALPGATLPAEELLRTGTARPGVPSPG